ncbi:MAG TPA: hypothetical protein VFQ61_02480 [Polyangiaceae bacterium]|nr:hypothetical protein [Polyangiaceae bacterium]
MSFSSLRLAMSVSLLGAFACSSGGIGEDPPQPPAGGGASGGSTQSGGGSQSGGASASGGNAQGGSSGNTQAGANTGGSARGGAMNGGSNAGGQTGARGGGMNGGSAQGGSTSAGGAAQGGSTAAGGNAAGGANGGSTSGGAANGGSATGGGANGGSANGGSAGSPGTCGPIADQLSSVEVTTPEGVRAGVRNWRVWASTSLNIAPVFTTPLANCGTLVCYTTGSGSTRRARVTRLDAQDKLVETYDLGAYECRGLAAEPDGHFGALLWEPGTKTDCADAEASGSIYVSRFDATGKSLWSKELTNLSTSGLGPNCPTEFGIGESRLEFGGGKYGAYYHVHSKSGHEGDTLKYVDLSGTESTTWSWGCSHSMSNVLRFNPTDSKFLPACVTDCYPGTGDGDFAAVSIGGIYLNNKTKVLDVDGGCNGSVAGELGGGAIAPSGWKLVFNAHQNPATLGQKSYNTSTMNQDIGFASVSSSFAPGAVKWLTNTPSIQEADSSIERLKLACDPTEQYLVGWAEPGSTYKYKLGRINANGEFLEAATDVTAKAKWGRRDDPFRAHANGDIVWAWFDAPNSTTLHFARVRSGGTAQCGN